MVNYIIYEYSTSVSSVIHTWPKHRLIFQFAAATVNKPVESRKGFHRQMTGLGWSPSRGHLKGTTSAEAFSSIRDGCWPRRIVFCFQGKYQQIFEVYLVNQRVVPQFRRENEDNLYRIKWGSDTFLWWMGRTHDYLIIIFWSQWWSVNVISPVVLNSNLQVGGLSPIHK